MSTFNIFFSRDDNKYKFSPENYGVLTENKELFFFPAATYANVQQSKTMEDTTMQSFNSGYVSEHKCM